MTRWICDCSRQPLPESLRYSKGVQGTAYSSLCRSRVIGRVADLVLALVVVRASSIFQLCIPRLTPNICLLNIPDTRPPLCAQNSNIHSSSITSLHQRKSPFPKANFHVWYPLGILVKMQLQMVSWSHYQIKDQVRIKALDQAKIYPACLKSRTTPSSSPVQTRWVNAASTLPAPAGVYIFSAVHTPHFEKDETTRAISYIRSQLNIGRVVSDAIPYPNPYTRRRSNSTPSLFPDDACSLCRMGVDSIRTAPGRFLQRCHSHCHVVILLFSSSLTHHDWSRRPNVLRTICNRRIRDALWTTMSS